jgi:hypothetical protein
MATFDFENYPIIVDFDNQFTSEDLNTIQENFQKIRAAHKDRSIFIVSPQDRNSVFWTKEIPTKQVKNIFPLWGEI